MIAAAGGRIDILETIFGDLLCDRFFEKSKAELLADSADLEFVWGRSFTLSEKGVLVIDSLSRWILFALKTGCLHKLSASVVCLCGGPARVQDAILIMDYYLLPKRKLP